MGLRLVSLTEKLEAEVDGAKFYYHRAGLGLTYKIQDDTAVAEGFGKKQKIKILSGSATRRLLRECVVGWENVEGDDGNPVEFNLDNLDRLPEGTANKLARAIEGKESVTEEEEKNLEEQ